MTLSRCIEEYVRHRRSLGVCFHGEQVRLSALVKSVGLECTTAWPAEPSVSGHFRNPGFVTEIPRLAGDTALLTLRRDRGPIRSICGRHQQQPLERVLAVIAPSRIAAD